MNRAAKQQIAEEMRANDPVVFIDHNEVLTVGITLSLNGTSRTFFLELKDEELETWEKRNGEVLVADKVGETQF